MLKKKFVFCFLVIVFSLNFLACLAINTVYAATENVPIPSVTDIVQVGQYASQPLIMGTSTPGFEVMIYIDGTFNGFADRVAASSYLDNFSYHLNSILSFGAHNLMVIGKDPTSLVLSPPSREMKIYIKPIEAPTVITPTADMVVGQSRPLISGLTVSGSIVHVYIDGVHNGQTGQLSDPYGTANFSYHPFLNLSIGNHSLWTEAEDQYGRFSLPSNTIWFRVEAPLPAPTLLKVISDTKNDQLIITGLTKNDTVIKAYIDHKLIGGLSGQNQPAGTIAFAIRLKYGAERSLTKGQHLVYTTAIDVRGKESQWSNIIYFQISETVSSRQPTISPTAATEENKEKAAKPKPVATSKPTAPKSVQPKTPAQTSTSTPATGEKVNPEIQNLLGQGKATTTGPSGAINENKVGQNKFNLNLIIFIIFLLGVIAWIFWVNRELIKERREQDQEKKDQDKDQPNLKL